MTQLGRIGSALYTDIMQNPCEGAARCYSASMDHLEVLREKIARLRAEIAAIQELNQEYRLREWVRTEAQVAHGQRHERLQAIQQELAPVADLGRRIPSVEKIREQNRARLPVVEQKRLRSTLAFTPPPTLHAENPVAKTKRPQLFSSHRGARLNSPPPKSAHNQPNGLGGRCEWPGWATAGL
jgi:hypothetical protein